MDDPFDIIAGVLLPDPVSVTPSPGFFYKSSNLRFHKALSTFIDVPPIEVYKALCVVNPELEEKPIPFIVFAVKPSFGKHTPYCFFILNHDHSFIQYDPTTETVINNNDKIISIDQKAEKSIKINFLSEKSLTFHTENSSLIITQLVNEFFNTEEPNALYSLMQSISILETPLIQFPAFERKIISVFMQIDMSPVRNLFYLPVKSSDKRTITNFFITLHSFRHDICYFIYYLVALYFKDPPDPPKILRSDTLLTNCLASIRDIFMPHFFKMTADYIASSLKDATSINDIIETFLKKISEASIPGVLRWLCWLLYDEASRAYPKDSDAPFYAVSGFFFLRGLGPQLAAIEDPDVRKKCSFINKLINYSSQPEISPFIPEFKNLLSKISLVVDSLDEMFPSLEDFKTSEAVGQLMSVLQENHELILKFLSENQPIGVPPMQWFLEREIELANNDFNEEEMQE